MATIQDSSSAIDGFPTKLEGPMTWTGSDYRYKPELYVTTITQDNIQDIGNAISHFKELGLTRGKISPTTFPLQEAFSKELRGINDEVNNGRGFAVLRGLQPLDYSEEDVIILYAGLTSHVASHRAGFIDHIRYEREDEKKGENLRPTELPVAMNFHTDADAGNILSMFTLSMSQRGGNQHLSSFWRVYNTMMEDNPEAIETLAQEWHWEKPNRADSARTNNIMHRPIVGHVDGKAQINFGSSFVAGHPKYPRSAAAPPLKDNQKSALDTLLAVAKQHSFQLSQQAGDILFVNNLSIMHARDSFLDDVDSSVQRHVLRLWLRDSELSWPVAESLNSKHDALYDTDPETQQLLTLSEWSAVARIQRVTKVGTTCSHD
jgi:hypothetical protein